MSREDRRAIADEFEARIADADDEPPPLDPKARPPAPNPWLMRIAMAANVIG